MVRSSANFLMRSVMDLLQLQKIKPVFQFVLVFINSNQVHFQVLPGLPFFLYFWRPIF